MNKVFIVLSGELFSDSNIRVIYKSEQRARTYAKNLVNKKNQDFLKNPGNDSFIIKPNPKLREAETSKTIVYWQSEIDFVRIDEWEVY